MIRSRKRLTFLILLGVVGTIAAPTMSQAAVAAPTVTVFGNKKPGDPGCDSATTGCGVLFATSKAYGAGEAGQLYYKGVADPGVLIDIVVDDELVDSDGIYVVSRVATASANADPDIDGYGPGEFGAGVPGGFSQDTLNGLTVTALGTHMANVEAGPSSSDPADWGGSTLYATFTARDRGADGLFDTADDVQSDPTTEPITKYAGTPNDARAPALSRTMWPPAHWCHLAGKGANMGGSAFGGPSMGGQNDGKCSDFAQSPFGAVPDVTWIFCTNEVSNPHKLIVPALPDNPFRQGYCNGPPGRYPPTGEAYIQGIATDDSPSSLGVASEVGSIKIQVTQGSDVYYTFDSEDAIVTREHAHITRVGTRLYWSMPMKIGEFEVNWPNGVPYKVTVTITDAWGHTSTASSPDIIVYPY